MATEVTGLTKERMISMENATIIDGNVVGNNLHLVTRGGTTVDAGNVRGPVGPSGSGHIICTSTTRPAMVAGDQGTSIYETDTDLVRTWIGARWRLQEYIICTSTTRPTALGTGDEGTRIYQTDNNFSYRWDGTGWRIEPRSICTSTTRPTGLGTGDEGVRIYETDTNDEFMWDGTGWLGTTTGVTRVLHEIIRQDLSGNLGNTALNIPGYNRTFTVVAGRQYYIRFECRLAIAVGDAYPCDVIIYFSGGAAPTLTSQFAHYENTLDHATWASFYSPLVISPGSHTIYVSGRCLTTGKAFQMTGDPEWPGLYQILEAYS
jgi:hypothetical protein